MVVVIQLFKIMNVNYVYINYLPGACGNFLSRALNLIDNSHCWVDALSKQMSPNADDKLKAFGYQSQIDRHLKDVPYNWVKFENNLQRYWLSRPHHSVPNGALSIMPTHFTHDPSHKDIAGPDDTEKYIQITTSDPKLYEWIHMNALFKNCTLGAAWMETHTEWNTRDDILFVELGNFFEWETFRECYLNVCKYIGVEEYRLHMQHVEVLYHQWVRTQLPMGQIPEFKKKIGWLL